MSRLIGLVLAGGQGRRMGGVNKGLQSWHGQPLIAHVMARLRPQVADIWISANHNRAAYGAYSSQVLADDAPSQGPLTGILTALHFAAAQGFSPNDALLVVPVDMPLLPIDLAQYLQQARTSLTDPTQQPLAITDQPLLVRLGLACTAPLARVLAQGEHSVHRAWSQLQGQTLDPPPHWLAQQSLVNMNTMQDLGIPMPASPVL